MAKRKPRKYTHPGGVLGVPRGVIRSPAYRDLTLAARCLMLVLQDVWKPFEPVIHYSARRAGKALNVGAKTAARAFLDLGSHGFIKCIDEADWFNGQARTYRLTWLSDDGREPTNEWLQWGQENKPSCHLDYGQAPKRVNSTTVDQKRANASTKNQ